SSGDFDQPPALACTTTVCMAAWANGYCGCDDCYPSCNAHIRGALFQASDGTRTGPAFDMASGPIATPTVASNGTALVVAWPFQAFGHETLQAMRVRASDGALGVPAFVIESADSVSSPAASSNGADYWFAWREDGAVAKVHGARVSSAGSVLDQ